MISAARKVAKLLAEESIPNFQSANRNKVLQLRSQKRRKKNRRTKKTFSSFFSARARASVFVV